ncbi:unnamed protein product, partial [marine sediment metagenome]
GNCPQGELFIDLVFKDKIFFEKYIQELEIVSKKSYLDDLFLELDNEIEQYTNILHKDSPSYRFSKEIFYRKQKLIRTKLGLESVKIDDEKKISNITINKSQPTFLKTVISHNSKLILMFFLLMLNFLLLLIVLFVLVKSRKFKNERRENYLT